MWRSDNCLFDMYLAIAKDKLIALLLATSLSDITLGFNKLILIRL